MLERRNDTAPPHAGCESARKIGDAFGVVAERARADHGAAAIDGEVEHRRKIEIRADAAQIVRHLFAEPSRQVEIVGGSYGHHRRHRGEPFAEARDAAAFLVDRYQRRRIVGTQGTKRVG